MREGHLDPDSGGLTDKGEEVEDCCKHFLSTGEEYVDCYNCFLSEKSGSEEQHIHFLLYSFGACCK